MNDKVSAWEVYVHRETGREIRAKRMSAEDAWSTHVSKDHREDWDRE